MNVERIWRWLGVVTTAEANVLWKALDRQDAQIKRLTERADRHIGALLGLRVQVMMLEKRVKSLETGAGEKKIANATTPTCESTGKNPEAGATWSY